MNKEDPFRCVGHGESCLRCRWKVGCRGEVGVLKRHELPVQKFMSRHGAALGCTRLGHGLGSWSGPVVLVFR